MATLSEGQAAAQVSPLTVLVKGVLEWTFPAGTLQDLFAEHADAQTTREATIDALFWLLVQVVSGARPSVFAAFKADQALDRPTLPVTHQALYQKLGRTDPAFATALPRHSADRLLPLLRHAGAADAGSWHGYQVHVLDGTDLGKTEHRLKVLRGSRSAGLPGRLVVEYDLACGLCVDAVASEDAYASEMVLVRALVGRAAAGQVYVADRNFCTYQTMAGLAGRGACFVIREHQKLRTSSRGKRRLVGRVETGRVFEEPVWVEDRHTGARLEARRLILELDEPTRDGDEAIRLLTNLPEAVSALEVVVLYRDRWTLEGHFDFVKNQLHGEIESLGQPRAALLMACLAMVAANGLAVVRQALKTAQGVKLEELSGYYLADELAGNYRAVTALMGEEAWREVAALPEPSFWQWGLALARQIRAKALQKQTRGPKKPPPKRTSAKKRPHVSTFRLLQEAKQRR
jgi:hypothetical protein